jgi:hypothetical protein
VDLAVKLAFITLYDLHHESEERWNGGRLTRLAADTRENGAALSRLRGAASADGFRLEAPGEVLLPAGIFTGDSLWDPAILSTPARRAQRRASGTGHGPRSTVKRPAPPWPCTSTGS